MSMAEFESRVDIRMAWRRRGKDAKQESQQHKVRTLVLSKKS